MEDLDAREPSMVLSALALRRAIGAIAILLPFVLAAGHLLAADAGLPASLSAYYWTDMRDLLVGALCVLGACLLAYRGPAPADAFTARLAGLAALGFALSPSRPDGALGLSHYGFEASFYAAQAVFALSLFRRTDPYFKPSRRKLLRNQLYAACGLVMLACMALVGVLSITWLGPALARLQPVLWLESAALLACGLAWLAKGEVLLADEQPWGSDPTITGPL
jgi:hypothetical protein